MKDYFFRPDNLASFIVACVILLTSIIFLFKKIKNNHAEKTLAKKRKIPAQEKAKKWLEYKEKFRKYNRAQKESELEWFKNKLIERYADSQDEKDILIHELEIIMLENNKKPSK